MSEYDHIVHPKIKAHPSKRVVILKHKSKGFYFPLIETARSKSLMRLQKKILTCGIEWDYHIICTFSEERIVHSRSGYVWSEQYILKDNNIRRLRTKIKSPKLERFEGCLKDLNYIVSGTLMRDMFTKTRNNNISISYVWKYEEGKKNFRPHFHILIKFKEEKMCAFCTWSMINKYWIYGRAEAVNIITKMQLERYVKKDFSKYSNLRFLCDFKRKWSTSRDVKAGASESEFKWDRILPPEAAIKLFQSTQPKFIEHYKNPIYDSHKFSNDLIIDLIRKNKGKPPT